MLLDLNLPRKDGREVLTEIKQDQGLRNIPVVILSSSASDDDVLASYRLHANSYIQKPSSFARYIEVVRALDVFWFQVVTFPPAV